MRSLLLILLISSVCIACGPSAPDNSSADTTSATEPATSSDNSAASSTPETVAVASPAGETLSEDEAPSSGTIEFDDPWIRMVPSVSPNSAAYVSITNGTEDSVTLTSISSQVADRIEIHNVEVDDAGTMSMFKINSLAIDPDSTTMLEPSGAHIMIYGLKEPLNEGEMVTMLMSFDNQPPIPVNFSVK